MIANALSDMVGDEDCLTVNLHHYFPDEADYLKVNISRGSYEQLQAYIVFSINNADKHNIACSFKEA